MLESVTVSAPARSGTEIVGNVSLDPWRIGKNRAAALVVLHFDHARTT
jgi:hypothetical protein